MLCKWHQCRHGLSAGAFVRWRPAARLPVPRTPPACVSTGAGERSSPSSSSSSSAAAAASEPPPPHSAQPATTTTAGQPPAAATAVPPAPAGATTTSQHTTSTSPSPPPPPHSSADSLLSLEPIPPAASTARDPQDASRLFGVCAAVAGLALTTELNKDWIGSHQEVAMGAVFLVGYIGIICEEVLGLSKAGVALLLAAALWSIRATGEGMQALDLEMGSALGEVSGVVFFLLGAMTVVEVVDSHQGFKSITQSVRPASKSQLLVAVSALTFVMSSVLDNLTTTIVMVALLGKLCPEPDTRRFVGAAVVVAANAGGAWTPIGDVTTTMLWIHGQISAWPTLRDLLLPSVVSVAVPVTAWALTAPELLLLPDTPARDNKDTNNTNNGHHNSSSCSMNSSSSDANQQTSTTSTTTPAAAAAADALAAAATDSHVAPAAAAAAAVTAADVPPRSALVLSVGLGSLLMVPVLRAWAGLPPYMGMLACLGFLWLVTDAIHLGEPDRSHLTVSRALKRVDSEAVLFFTGVLLAVAALDKAGLLRQLAAELGRRVPQNEVVAGIIGVASAVVDNVPLVAATMGMYDMQSYPQDSSLWQLIAYCAGTGGSLLVIGSAAGVAFMGMDRSVSFAWYARRITPWAAVGYAAGLATYLAQHGAGAAAAGVGH